MGKGKTQKDTNRTLDRLGLVVDLDAHPHDALRHVRVRFTDSGDSWPLYPVEWGPPSCIYYVYLFILSTLAVRRMAQNDSHPRSAVLSEPHWDSFLVHAQDEKYGHMVTYLYNVKELPGKKKQPNYRALNKRLREGIKNLFLARCPGDARHNAWIELAEWVTTDTFRFWSDADFTRLIPQPSAQTEVDATLLESMPHSISARDLVDLHDRIVHAQFWLDQARLSKRRRSLATGRNATRSAKKTRAQGTVTEPLLQSVEEFLEVWKSPPKWFRRCGPVWKDFEEGVVYRRAKLLEHLKELIHDSHVSLLSGASATGKTALVRHLAYELHHDGTSVHCFQRTVSFDPDALVGEIRNTEGVVIIEDVHLNPVIFQEVLARVSPNRPAHVLFTGRPSFCEYPDPNRRPFSEIASLQLTRSEDLDPWKWERTAEIINEDVDGIISHFAAAQRNASLSWSNKTREVIKQLAGDSLWLLAWALMGYADSGDDSNPRTWQSGEVQQFLGSLEDPHIPHSEQFPEILVALSPLYRNEIPTAERYLVQKLGFQPAALNALVARGEIRRFREANHVFYGLQHSAHAETYWEHGQSYRDRRGLPDLEEFIYDYVRENSPNDIAVVTSGDESMRRRLLLRLCREKALVRIVNQKHSLMAVAKWLCVAPTVDDELLQTVNKKVLAIDDPQACGRCIRAVYRHRRGQGRKLWGALQGGNLAAHLSLSTDVGGVGTAVGSLLQVDPEAAHDLCEQLNLIRLSKTMSGTPSGFDVLWCLLWLTKANQDVGHQLLQRLDSARIRCQMVGLCTIHEVFTQPVEHILQDYLKDATCNQTEQRAQSQPLDVSVFTSEYVVAGYRPDPPLAPWDCHHDQLGDLGAIHDMYKRDKEFLRLWWEGVASHYGERFVENLYVPRSSASPIVTGKTRSRLRCGIPPSPKHEELWWSLITQGAENRSGDSLGL